MSFYGFLWNACWREADKVTRAVQTVAVTVPFLIALVVGLFGGEWSKEFWPAWAWASITSGAVIFALVVGITRRAYALEKNQEPRLTCNDIGLHHNMHGESLVRVQLQNISSNALGDIKPYLDKIVADDPLREIEKIDFRVPLYTQERLRERFSPNRAEDSPEMPVKFSERQPKWVEIFQVVNAVERQINIVSGDGINEMIALPRMEFKCSVYGLPSPIFFSIIYEEISVEGKPEGEWQATLINEQGETFGPVKPERYDE